MTNFILWKKKKKSEKVKPSCTYEVILCRLRCQQGRKTVFVNRAKIQTRIRPADTSVEVSSIASFDFHCYFGRRTCFLQKTEGSQEGC